jgi:hypothetical protein
MDEVDTAKTCSDDQAVDIDVGFVGVKIALDASRLVGADVLPHDGWEKSCYRTRKLYAGLAMERGRYYKGQINEIC